jgi:hypothetical protein
MMTFGHTISSPFSDQVTWRVLEANGGSVDGLGHYQAPDQPGTYHLQVASVADPAKTARATVTVVAAPQGPLTAPQLVESGASGLRASVPASPGLTYAWTVAGGSLLSSATGSEIRFSVGWEPKVVLSCRLVNPAGDAVTLVQEIPKAPPVSFHLDQSSVTLTVGQSMRFGYALSGGLKPTVIWSVPDPSQGYVDQAGKYQAPDFPGRYTVLAVPDATPKLAARIEVNVVQRPVGEILAPKQVAPDRNGLKATVSARSGLKIEWSIMGGQISGPIDGKTVTFSSGHDPELVLSCKLTNEAGDTFTARVHIALVPGM